MSAAALLVAATVVATPTDVLIYFEHDSAVITQAGREVLKIVVFEASREAQLDGALPQLVLEGHADRVGQETYNLALSRRRAQAVRDHLIRLGYSEASLSTQGYGESSPVIPTADDIPEADNRRVHVHYVTGRRAGLCAGPPVCGRRN